METSTLNVSIKVTICVFIINTFCHKITKEEGTPLKRIQSLRYVIFKDSCWLLQ